MLAAGTTAPTESAYLWPCNLQAWTSWCAVQTQWRVGTAGATGLDYAGVRAYLDEQGAAHGSDERRDIWVGICAAERATLDVWAEQSRQNKQG